MTGQRDISAILRRASYKAGLSLEQRGAARLKFRIRQGAITLRFAGDEALVGDVESALEQIEIWKARVTWRVGQIVELVKAVNKLLATHPLTSDASHEVYDKIETIADDLGLVCLGAEPTGLHAEGDAVGFYVDGNQITWCVYAISDDEVRYVRAKELDHASARDEDVLPDG